MISEDSINLRNNTYRRETYLEIDLYNLFDIYVFMGENVSTRLIISRSDSNANFSCTCTSKGVHNTTTVVL